ncbi:MAG: MarC family protein [Phycisphaeraceae bacterium]
MDHPLVHFSTVLVAFLAIMNPIANTPVFLGLTSGLSDRQRRLVATRSILFAFLIVLAFTLTGNLIFELFGISLPAFRIAGGVLVALVGYHMLQGESSRVHHPSEDDQVSSQDDVMDMAVSPLAMPLLAGPGTIATAMSYAAQGGVGNQVRVAAAFAVVCLVTLGFFLGGRWFVGILGQNAIKVITRLMGLILAVVGVEMLIAGIRGAVAGA